jgi:hypothetical protein
VPFRAPGKASSWTTLGSEESAETDERAPLHGKSAWALRKAPSAWEACMGLSPEVRPGRLEMPLDRLGRLAGRLERRFGHPTYTGHMD